MSFTTRLIQAWEAGGVLPNGDGWDPTGNVEPDPPPVGEGSQTPPARDHDGRVEDPEQAVYEWQKQGDVLLDQCYRVTKLAQRHLRAFERTTSVDFIRLPGFGKTMIPKGVHISWEDGVWTTEIRGKTQSFTDPKKLHDWLTNPAWLRTGRTKTAGEVRFIKDRSGDEKQWGWGAPSPVERSLSPEFEFVASKRKPLATTLRASLAALGHTMSAYQTFAKIKSATISPDGSLGGKGYIQKISEMRRQYMNVVEALSALTDTIYDEVNAPHWNPVIAEQSPRERQEVREIMDDAEEIKEDPEGWAEEEEAEMDAENDKGKKASRRKAASRVSRVAEKWGSGHWKQSQWNPEDEKMHYVSDVGQFRIRRVTAAFRNKEAGRPTDEKTSKSNPAKDLDW